MKKEYIIPEIVVETIALDDVIASSGTIGGQKPGDAVVDINNIWSDLFD